jgi:predicted acyl esterase
LLERTLYGGALPFGTYIYTMYTELARSGYIFVFSDIWGRFKFEGSFLMLRPLVDHANQRNTEAYDTVDRLVKNLANHNGRVGIIGGSYRGLLAMEAGINPHPAVKAISPQAPMIDAWTGDDFFHHGAFRQTVSYDFVLLMESSKDLQNPRAKMPDDEYDFHLKAGSFDALTRNAPNPNHPCTLPISFCL